MHSFARLLVLSFTLSLVAACGSSPSEDIQVPPSAKSSAPVNLRDSRLAHKPEPALAPVVSSKPAEKTVIHKRQKRIRVSDLSKLIYFGFDKAFLASAATAKLDKVAVYLNDHPRAKLRVEGHADERGTKEYNMGLGQNRAQVVRSYLISRHVNPKQISVVSYGETRPAMLGATEEAFRKNRRVELVFLR